MQARSVCMHRFGSPGQGRQGRHSGVAGMPFHTLGILRALGRFGGELK